MGGGLFSASIERSCADEQVIRPTLTSSELVFETRCCATILQSFLFEFLSFVS